MSDPELQRAAEALFRGAQGNPRRLAMLAAQFQRAAGEASKGGTLEVVGGVSATTGKPYVQLSWGGESGQLDVEQARGHAHLVLEACTNAVADAAILAWARDELELELEKAIVMIDAFRRYRADKWGQPDLRLEFEKPPPEEDP